MSPIGCNCGGTKTAPINYQVTFKDGSKQTYTTSIEAQTAIRDKKGGMMRAVPAGAK